MRKRAALMLALANALAAPALGQTNISKNNKYSWAENCGWMNWRDAGPVPGVQGVRLGPTCLSGYIWCENTGWISLGDGSPGDGTFYTNQTGADFGVNLASDGSLTGYAWGENVGWINFGGGALATPPNPARYDAGARRFRGYAWGENIGWINLDTDSVYVGVNLCPADFNQSGGVTVQDIFDFLAAFFAGDAAADINFSGEVSVQDVFDFLAAYFAGCE